MDWTKAPKKKIRLAKSFSMGWFDMSGFSLADLRKITKSPPPNGSEPKAHDFWFEAHMEIRRRNR